MSKHIQLHQCALLNSVFHNKKSLVLFSLLTISTACLSQSIFTKPASFKLSQQCQATNSIRGSSGAIELNAGTRHIALGENAPSNATHVYIAVDGKNKWISVACGAYESEKPPFKTSKKEKPRHDQATQECLPFFDNETNPVQLKFGGSVDITPPAPAIDDFGAAVNQVCGHSGKKTSRSEFLQLMKAHPKVLSELMNYTGGKVFSQKEAAANQDVYLKDLAEAWYAIHAFDHIFCGETATDNNKIGGLHYYGRYEQLQASGEACRLPNYKSNEVIAGSVYSMGVRMKKENGAWIYHDIKGYGLTLSAGDILKAATRAFAENPTASAESTACLLDVKDGNTNYTTVFVRRRTGIRTFYPDATPDTSNTRPCKAPIELGMRR